MEKQPVVTCVYAEDGGDAGEIIVGSFHLFLQKELQNPGLVTQDGQRM